MAGKGGDVELVIRAKDAVTKVIESVVSTLNEFSDVSKEVTSTGKGASTVLGNLRKEFSDLNREAKNLAAIGKVAGELDRAASAVGRMESELRSSASELARLARESETASANVSRLNAALDAERRSIEENGQSRRAARAELSETNKALRQAERNQDRYNKAVANTPDVKRGSATRSAAAFIEGDLASQRANQTRLTAEVAAYAQSIERARDTARTLTPELSAATRLQDRLARDTDKASKALGSQRTSLQTARSELGQLRASVDGASDAFGDMAFDQEKVAQASNRMAAEMARVQARIDGLQEASGRQIRAAPGADTGDLGKQRRQLLELRREWVNAEAEVKRLAQAMRATQAPTEAMGQALGRAQAASARAKSEYQAQQIALHRLAGSAQSSFGAFDKSATRMATAAQTVNRSIGTLGATSDFAANAIRPIAPSASAAGAALSGAGKGADQAARGIGSVGENSRRALSLSQRLRGEVLSLTTSFIGFFAVFDQIGGVVKAFQTLEAAQNRLGSVFDQDTAAVGRELEWLQRQSARLGINFSVLAEEYGKFVIAAKAANFSASNTRDIFLAVAEAGRVNKLSMDQLSGVFLALQQMISKGKVTSEELRRQLGDRLAGAFNIFAEALGLTAAQLDAAMQKGEVFASESNLLAFGDELRRRFGPQLAEALQSTTSELGRFADNVFKAQVQVGEGGFIEAFTRGLRALNAYFASREGRDFFLSLGAALGRLVDGLALVPRYFELIRTAILTIIALKLGSYVAGVVAGLRGATGALGASLATFYSWNATASAATGIIARFSGATAATGGALAGLAVQLRLAQLGFTLLGARTTAAMVALSGLRTIAVAVTGTFRLLWAAIGGVPGIILTGITIALGSWLTSVDDTTAALDEHKRIMGEVITAYESVTDKTRDWGREIRNVTLDQAVANLRKMREQLAAARDDVADYGNLFSLTFRADQGAVRDVQRLRNEFLEGTRNAASFRSELEAVYGATTDDGLRTYLEGLLALVRKLADAEVATGEAALSTERLGGATAETAAEIARAGVSMASLTAATESAEGVVAKTTAQADAFRAALAGIRAEIPGLKAELDRLDQVAALDKLYGDAARAARTMSELAALTRDYNSALDAINTKSIEAQVSNGGLVDRIIGVESAGDPAARNPNSTATGLGQFIESTWERMFRQYFPDRAEGMTREAILALRSNADISRKMVELYVRENASVLQKAGVATTDAALYLAHFLGPNGAVRVLSASGDTPVSQLLGQDQIASNRSVLDGKTAREVTEWAQRKLGVSEQELAIQRELSDAERERAQTLAEEDEGRRKKVADFQAAFDAQISDAQFEISIAKDSNREQEIARALRKANNDAIAAGTVLTEAQKRSIVDTTGALFDQRNAVDGLKGAEETVNQLYGLRQQLLEQREMSRENGDLDKANALGQRIGEINRQLGETIGKAIAMWQAVGGPEADAAIAKLQTMEMSIAGSGVRLNAVGLGVQQMGSLAASFGDGVAGVFDNFAQAIATGEKAVDGLKNAFLDFASSFLREMAQMILRQLALNAIQRVVGFAVPGASVGIAHTGGIVGSRRTGSNGTRRVNPAIFAGAMRLHSGGIPGLKPGEVPTILKQNEEVLTRSDPRHALNGGGTGSGGTSSPGSMKIVNVFDPAAVLEAALATEAGEKVLINHVNNRSRSFKAAIG